MRITRPIPFKNKKTFAVVVDGDCEVWYLQMLKRNERSIIINFEPQIPQKKSLLQQFEKVIELSAENTKVFWIIDFDTITSETKKAKAGNETAIQQFLRFKKTLSEKYKNSIVIVNNPCFEYWLLLHFEHTSKYFENCQGAQTQLKKYLKEYEKNKKFYIKPHNDIYLRLKPNLAAALKNAKALGLFEPKYPNRGISEMQLFFEADEFGELFKRS